MPICKAFCPWEPQISLASQWSEIWELCSEHTICSLHFLLTASSTVDKKLRRISPGNSNYGQNLKLILGKIWTAPFNIQDSNFFFADLMWPVCDRPSASFWTLSSISGWSKVAALKVDQHYGHVRLWILQFCTQPPSSFGEKRQHWQFPDASAGGTCDSLTQGQLAPKPRSGPEISPKRCWKRASRAGPSHSTTSSGRGALLRII